MALTRKYLKAMGIDDEKIDQIIESHSETVSALKEERDGYKVKAGKLDDVQKQLDDATASLADTKDDGYKKKYEDTQKAFDDFKNDITTKETRSAKESAVKAYFKTKGVSEKGMALAMRYVGNDVDTLELDGDNFKDTKTLDDALSGDLASLVETSSTKGADVATPPEGAKDTGATVTMPSFF